MAAQHRYLRHRRRPGGLNRPSWAMCEAVRAVSLERFGQLIGTATSVSITAITNQLLLWLDHRD